MTDESRERLAILLTRIDEVLRTVADHANESVQLMKMIELELREIKDEYDNDR